MADQETSLEEDIRDYRKMKGEAEQELDEFQTRQQFETKSELKDKNGNLTKVLEIDLDKGGILGMQARLGNPFRLDRSTGDTITDDVLLFKYFEATSNINLSDENLSLIGRKAMTKARSTVANFFMLLLVSELPEAPVMEK